MADVPSESIAGQRFPCSAVVNTFGLTSIPRSPTGRIDISGGPGRSDRWLRPAWVRFRLRSPHSAVIRPFAPDSASAFVIRHFRKIVWSPSSEVRAMSHRPLAESQEQTSSPTPAQSNSSQDALLRCGSPNPLQRSRAPTSARGGCLSGSGQSRRAHFRELVETRTQRPGVIDSGPASQESGQSTILLASSWRMSPSHAPHQAKLLFAMAILRAVASTRSWDNGPSAAWSTTSQSRSSLCTS